MDPNTALSPFPTVTPTLKTTYTPHSNAVLLNAIIKKELDLTSKIKQAGEQKEVSKFDKVITHLKIKGRLVHPKKDLESTSEKNETVALAAQKVALYKTACLRDVPITGTQSIIKNNLFTRQFTNDPNTLVPVQSKTDKDGNFSLKYDWTHRVYDEKTNFILKVLDTPLKSEDTGNDRVIASFPYEINHQYKTEDTNKIQTIDLGDLQVKYYEAQKGMPALEIDDLANRPQQSSSEYIQKLISAVLGGSKDAVVKLIEKWFPAEKAEKILGLANSDVKLSSDTTLDLILNGISQAQFRKGKNPGEFIYEINWDKYKKAASPLLPNASITLKIVDGKLEIKDVTVDKDDKPTTYAPGHPDFERVGLYLFNSSAFVKGEGVDHLSKGHLMVGQLALSFFRHIKNHPIRDLLVQHLDGVSEIDRLGADAIFGDHGILTLSALPPAEITQLLKDTLSTLDFRTYQPNDLLLEESKRILEEIKSHTWQGSHKVQERFAIAKRLAWDIISEDVDESFVKKYDKIVAEETWYELYDMSQNLMRESLPYTFKGDQEKEPNWVDRSEIDRPEVEGRVSYDDHWRTIRPFISSRSVPKNKETLNKELEALKQFCRYAKFFSTFYHSGIHGSQSIWATNIDVASLAPELMEKDGYQVGTTDELKALKQTAIAEILVGFDAPKLMADQYKNISIGLRQRLDAHKENFRKLGYPVEQWHSAIWI